MPKPTRDPENSDIRRILIVDDHAVVRRGLVDLVNQEPGLEVCAEAGGAAAAIKAVEKHNPDAAIIDISLGDTSGLELIKQLKVLRPQMRTLVLSMHEEELYCERALHAGAHGYVMKDRPPEQIIRALRSVLNDRLYVSDRMSARLIEKVAGTTKAADVPLTSTLSDRELEVFELLGRGQTTGEIADTLHLSVKTVQSHRENLKRKLKLHNSTELLQRAILWWQEQSRSR
ncbi:MAG: response regulator transcription factor [Verrucomicrobia bacterium]|nr:response regulator transcription factor [Verrucomicrobiota bacterium]